MENLRNLLALARTGADRHQVGHVRWKFLTWCADSDILEVRTLAATVDRWWTEIAAFIDTGRSNAKSEGINRVIKLVARKAVLSCGSLPFVDRVVAGVDGGQRDRHRDHPHARHGHPARATPADRLRSTARHRARGGGATIDG
ncbi:MULTISPECIES: transposase [Streptomyces]|uniref:Transposase IS204/IS1001/IS1096/IS1165 DDE domain-containing protein n=1 Tax=Streptomyces dengpaensis TaxID=2049881 RepID=A0ABM6T196_9ACTN|nr:hypothetical protein C4B68_00145 [Streptomyces dengpaensis]PIA98510.1 hypothetical protein B1C81_39785 [Streptomyces sp. HG99]